MVVPDFGTAIWVSRKEILMKQHVVIIMADQLRADVLGKDLHHGSMPSQKKEFHLKMRIPHVRYVYRPEEPFLQELIQITTVL